MPGIALKSLVNPHHQIPAKLDELMTLQGSDHEQWGHKLGKTRGYNLHSPSKCGWYTYKYQ